MKRDDKQSVFNNGESGINRELFPRIDFPFRKSGDEVWKEISDKIEDQEEAEDSLTLHSNRTMLGVAATITLLLALTLFLRFYTKDHYTSEREQLTANLPDGTVIELNEGSSLSYHPLWWRFSRRVEFEGEAFFRVQPGNSFCVKSETGVTEVLGTSFNVYSRSSVYKVSCLTGSVKVRSNEKDLSVTLLPYEEATIHADGSIEVKLMETKGYLPAWKSNNLVFKSIPLRDVFNEIELQYGIKISTQENLDFIYTGNFYLDGSVENVLSLICMPFDLEYVQKSNTEYQIKPKLQN